MIDIEAQNRFASFLGRKLDASQVVVANVSPIGGGYSRVMIRFDVTIDGVPRSLVARMDPPPDRSVAKSDRGAEWNVLDALTRYGKVSLPAAHCYDADGEVTIDAPAPFATRSRTSSSQGSRSSRRAPSGARTRRSPTRRTAR